MKTPRDLLLERHHAAQPRLNALRRAVVAEHVGGPALEPDVPPPDFFSRLWEELFWSCRRAWVGLATVWIVILGLQLATREPVESKAAAARPEVASSAVQMVLREQRQLRAELLNGSAHSPRAADDADVPGPRSEKRFGLALV